MKLVALPAFLTFFLAAALVVNFSSAVLLYLLFNFLIVVIIFWSYKPCKEELDELLPLLLSSCGDICVTIKGENDNNEKAQDNDVDEEIDENLEKRIEDFIAKVNYGWREEMLRDQ
ncbi:hypothetical protein NC651_022994 [Populus alba x Populus x berolinensis]|nr:hypothetical protein NC651_022994 [Populus alba x Populus x berolinensis]